MRTVLRIAFAADRKRKSMAKTEEVCSRTAILVLRSLQGDIKDTRQRLSLPRTMTPKS